MKNILLFTFLVLSVFQLQAQPCCDLGKKVGFADIIQVFHDPIISPETGEEISNHLFFFFHKPDEALCIPSTYYKENYVKKIHPAFTEAVKNSLVYKKLKKPSQRDFDQPSMDGLRGLDQYNELKNSTDHSIHIEIKFNVKPHISDLKKCDEMSEKENNSNASINKENSYKNTTNSTSAEIKQQKNNGRKNAQEILDNRKKSIQRQEEFIDKLSSELTSKFTELQNSWAKEQQFQSKINNLKQIQSKDIKNIIDEVHEKTIEIDALYAQKEKTSLTRDLNATNNLINSATNEKQALVGGIGGLGLTLLEQNRLKREREEKLTELEKQKEKAIRQEVNRFRKPYRESHRKNIELMSLALNENDAIYYMNLALYDECIINNALEIILNEKQCELKQTSSKPVKKQNHTAQEYYDAYRFKDTSKYTHISKNADYFLELAIAKQPNNIEWLLEKSNRPTINIIDKETILRQVLKINPYHEIAKKDLEKIESENRVWKELNQIAEQNETLIINNIDRSLFSTGVSLKENFVMAIPDDIGNAKPLKVLALYGCGITRIPNSLGDLPILEIIRLGDNKIKEIPKSIGNLTNLKELKLSDNQISEIPASLGNLKNLTYLDLSGNLELSTLPKEIGQLRNLYTLDLRGTNIKTLPESMSSLKKLGFIVLPKKNKKYLKPYTKKMKEKTPNLKVQYFD